MVRYPIRLDLSRAHAKAGSSSAARIVMIAMTALSLTTVKAAVRRPHFLHPRVLRAARVMPNLPRLKVPQPGW